MSSGLIVGDWIEDDLFLIGIEGDFDGSMRDQAIGVTTRALEAKPRAILVDVKRCTFLDSTAIAVIVGARRRAIDANIKFVMVGHNPTIDRTIELTGLRTEMVIVRDREEAIANLSS